MGRGLGDTFIFRIPNALLLECFILALGIHDIFAAHAWGKAHSPSFTGNLTTRTAISFGAIPSFGIRRFIGGITLISIVMDDLWWKEVSITITVKRIEGATGFRAVIAFFT